MSRAILEPGGWEFVVTEKKDRSPSSVTKAHLADAIYARHGGLTKREATTIVDAIFTTVKATLSQGRPVRITNFGSFEITARPGRRGVNPTSGEELDIPAHRGLTFRPARRLKTQVAKPGDAKAPRPRKREE